MANQGVNQSQKQVQGLVLTPQLRQSLRILQVPAAELLREINRTRSVVVVEHDMAFVRALGVKVTVLHEGSVLAMVNRRIYANRCNCNLFAG